VKSEGSAWADHLARGGNAKAEKPTQSVNTTTDTRPPADFADILSKLPTGRNSGVRTVGSEKELDDLYRSLTSGGLAIHVPGYRGSWIERSDGIRVGMRDASKSGGRTIDIRYPDGTIRKVHVE
jgi:hypothetical protein